MKAVIFKSYGSPEVLQMTDVKKPAPKNDEVLIKIHATTVTAADYRLRSSLVPLGFWCLFRLGFGIFGPRQKVLGVELAGEIEAVGKDVTRFAVGDQIFAFSGGSLGGYAEYKCMPEHSAIAKKPTNATYEEAAVLSFGGSTALYFLREKGQIRAGHKVLVNGASGGVGTSAVQLAKYFGAEVTGVCSSANVELVRSLGADHVIDYTQEDFTNNGQMYDLILDTVGNVSFGQCKPALDQGGKLLAIVAGIPQFLQMLWTSLFSNKKIVGGVAPETAEDLIFFKDLVEAGKLKPVIDRRYPLEQVVEAHRYADSGRKRGSIALTLG